MIKRMTSGFNMVYKYRFLLQNLIQRDIKVKYRRSTLGILWSVLNPLMMMIVLTLVFSYFFRFDIENYPVYILSGQLIFNYFTESTSMAMESVIGYAPLIKKVYVPKYMYPLSGILYNYVIFLISLIVLVLVALVLGVKPTWHVFEAIIPLLNLNSQSISVDRIEKDKFHY